MNIRLTILGDSENTVPTDVLCLSERDGVTEIKIGTSYDARYVEVDATQLRRALDALKED